MSAQKFTIAEAHRATGKAESTIRLHLKDRKNPLSYEKTDSGKILIDAAELMRRYPGLTAEKLETAKLKPNQAGQGRDIHSAKDSSLEAQLLKKDLEHMEDIKKRLEKEADHFKDLYQEARADKKDINKFIALIEDMSKQRANQSNLKDEQIETLKTENLKLKQALKTIRDKKPEPKKSFFENLFKS